MSDSAHRNQTRDLLRGVQPVQLLDLVLSDS